MFELTPRRRFESPFDLPAPRDLFERFFGEMVPSFFREGREMIPAFDVSERDDHILVKADLPGINVKDLDISVSGNVLTVRGERKAKSEAARQRKIEIKTH